MPNQTQEEFLRDLNPNPADDIFNQPLIPEGEGEPGTPAVPATEEGKETDAQREERLNRRDRRYIKKLEADRETAIEMADRLARITEAQKARTEEPSEHLKQIERIYGTGSPEAAEATELLKSALRGVEERSTNRALEMFREEQRKIADEEAKELKTLDSMVEEIEDDNGVTMDEATQKGFFQLLQKLSPKDERGTVIAYADPQAVWEELQARKAAPSSRAKDLAARSMVTTGASPKTGVEADANERWLRENGII